MFRKTFDQYMVNTYVFYLTLFRNLIFKLKEPILILIWMFIICIVFSILINKIEKLIFTLLGVIVNEKENIVRH